MTHLIILALILLFSQVNGHARLLGPAARSSAWRFSPKFPIEYTDNQMNCGGFWKQWSAPNLGRCSICGEDWSLPAPRLYDLGGPRYVGALVGTYTAGQIMQATVEVTANHLGYFEFRMCNLDLTPGQDATQDCLDKNLLFDVFGNSRQMVTANNIGILNYQLMVPKGLTCAHCVFQVSFFFFFYSIS
jgi:hypothetical protein